MSVCCSEAAAEVTTEAPADQNSKMKTFVARISVRPTFLVQVLDTTHGEPAASLPVTLYQQTTQKGWETVEEGHTLQDGHLKLLKDKSLAPDARYKLHLETEHYFSEKGKTPVYPFIELGLHTSSDCKHLQVSVHIGLHGYSTYIGT